MASPLHSFTAPSTESWKLARQRYLSMQRARLASAEKQQVGQARLREIAQANTRGNLLRKALDLLQYRLGCKALLALLICCFINVGLVLDKSLPLTLGNLMAPIFLLQAFLLLHGAILLLQTVSARRGLEEDEGSACYMQRTASADSFFGILSKEVEKHLLPGEHVWARLLWLGSLSLCMLAIPAVIAARIFVESYAYTAWSYFFLPIFLACLLFCVGFPCGVGTAFSGRVRKCYIVTVFVSGSQSRGRLRERWKGV